MKKTKPEKERLHINVSEGLIRYTNAKYYARFMVNGKDVRQSLRTTDLTLARRRLRDLRADLEQTGDSGEQLTFRQLCERYLETTLHREPKTVATKRRACEAIEAKWPGGSDVLISQRLSNEAALPAA